MESMYRGIAVDDSIGPALDHVSCIDNTISVDPRDGCTYIPYIIGA